MKLHERHFQVVAGRIAIHEAIDRLCREHDLTDIEALQAVSEWQDRVLKYMLRVERHGDADIPAGLERS